MTLSAVFKLETRFFWVCWGRSGWENNRHRNINTVKTVLATKLRVKQRKNKTAIVFFFSALTVRIIVAFEMRRNRNKKKKKYFSCEWVEFFFKKLNIIYRSLPVFFSVVFKSVGTLTLRRLMESKKISWKIVQDENRFVCWGGGRVRVQKTSEILKGFWFDELILFLSISYPFPIFFSFIHSLHLLRFLISYYRFSFVCFRRSVLFVWLFGWFASIARSLSVA